MNPSIHIQAVNGTDFYQQVATFSYGSSVHHGIGAALITQSQFLAHGDCSVKAYAVYVPLLGICMTVEIIQRNPDDCQSCS